MSSLLAILRYANPTTQDGTSFLYQTSRSTSWFSDYLTALSALRRYGPTSPYRMKKAVSDLLSKFTRLYDPTWLAQRGVTESVEEFAERLELGNGLTTRFGDDWAKSLGMGDRWIGEIMEGSTRCNVGSYT
jgi:prenylcysteine oxidase/farnesylcysteine lyase